MKQAIAYIRKSRVTNDHTVSWEVQEQAVRALAANDGQTGDLLILSDWNRSGRGTNLRPGYRRMLALIEADQVGAVYAYSLSRLSRSLRDFSELVELCQAHEVEIHLHAEPFLDFSRATGRMIVNILAAIAQMEAEIAKERSIESVAIRRARGDRIGQGPYGERPGEDLEALVAAYREAGSVMRAARLLNDRGVPTRSGKPWGLTSLRVTLVRLGERPKRTQPGVKASAPFMFYRLLRCHCGGILTGSREPSGATGTYTSYKCFRGLTISGHGRLSVSERPILAWAMAEAARLRTPDAVEQETRDETQRTALGARRQRVIDNYEDGLIDKRERDAKIAAIVAELERLDATRAIVLVPEIDWAWPARDLNGVLRALWDHIELDEQMHPVRAEWLVPEWRARDDPLLPADGPVPGNRA